MRILVVVNNPAHWPLELPGVEVVQARKYLSDETYSRGTARVFNLCRSYSYQATGYYVSLLAEARGHRPIPDITTVRDLQSPSIYRLVSEELDDMIQRAFTRLQGDKFMLSVYFGRNLAKRYDRVALHLFNLFRAPMLRAEFERKDGRWDMRTIRLIGINDVPDSHRSFLVESASRFLNRGRWTTRRRKVPRYEMAILCNPDDQTPPSNAQAIQHFIRAAASLDIDVEIIGKDDISRLAEFDALFIRETTNVNNHTYRCARRAEAEGLVVIDDPVSIVRCTNKVYLAEVMARHRIPNPRTVIIQKDNLDEALAAIGTPCILKQPDSQYSLGVVKAADPDEFMAKARALLQQSDLVIAQAYMPTPFDWRVGLIDGRALYACRYYMAGSHWQIVDRSDGGNVKEGRVETVSVKQAPPKVISTAIRAAEPFGQGLYGVDLKEVNGKCYVVEINDNPSIDAGYEDTILKDKLYLEIMRVFLKRLEARHL
ncbi:MAG: RimK family protein [Verrucomicrobia bacterium]|nr:RimK family protein [Verrucomicrobiota bacterium]